MASPPVEQGSEPPRVVLVGAKCEQPAMLSSSNWQTPGSLSTPDAGTFSECSARGLENGMRTGICAIEDSMQAAQVDAFRQIRSQFSNLALQNVHLRAQLGEAVAGDHGQAWVEFARRTAPLDGTVTPAQQSAPVSPKPAAKPTTPSGECAVLDQIEDFTLPHAPATTREGLAGELARPDLPRPADAWRSVVKTIPTGHLHDAKRPVSLPELRTLAPPCAPASIEELRRRQKESLCARKSRQRTSLVVKSQLRSPRPAVQVSLVSRESTASSTWITPAVHKVNKVRIFPDKTELMAQVQDSLAKPEYKVSNFYHREGIAQQIASSSLFASTTLVVIVLNSIWIAIDTDHNSDPLQPHAGFVVVENLFCVFFLCELIVRFSAFRRKQDCLKDSWFVFDAVLVVLGVSENWVMVLVSALSGWSSASLTGQSSSMLRLIRMARLARTARMARLLRAVPEVMVIFKGIQVASHAVVCTVFLLTVIIYVFALALIQLTKDSPLGETLFPTVPYSMGTLLLRATLPDIGDWIYNLSDSHVLFGIVGLCFACFSLLVVLNMLAGMLLHVVLVVAELEKEEADATFVKNALPVILDLGDTDGDCQISREEFDALLLNPQAAKVLEQCNVDVMGLVELSDFMFSDGKDSLHFEEFFKLLLTLRGSNKATVKDIVDMRKFIVQEISLLEASIGGMVEQILAHVSKTTAELT